MLATRSERIEAQATWMNRGYAAYLKGERHTDAQLIVLRETYNRYWVAGYLQARDENA